MDGRIAPIGRQSIEDRSAVLVRGWVNERARAPQLPVSGPLRWAPIWAAE